jgi:rhodanese-related sulfurtransferase
MDQIKELDSGNDLPRNSPSSPSIRVVDLRSTDDFNNHHITGAYSCPAPHLTADTKTPFDFGDPNALVNQWKDLNTMLENSELVSKFFGADGPVLILCYNGETSRLLTAMVRGRGVDAYSFRGGVSGLIEYLDSHRN